MSYSRLGTDALDDGVARKSPKHRESSSEKEKKFLKDIGGKWAERYSLSLVSPSVVPNFYPTLRVVEYNITGLENEHPAMGPSLPAAIDTTIGQDPLESIADRPEEGVSPINDLKKKHQRYGKKKKPVKHPFRMPSAPSATSAPGPAYSPQPFTLTSYTQYLANLTFINSDFENSGLTLEQYIGINKTICRSVKTEESGKFEFEVEYDTKTDMKYRMKDMTLKSYLDLAQRIAREDNKEDGKGESVWDALPSGRQVIVGTQEPEDLEEHNEHRQDYQRSKRDKRKEKHKKHKKHKKHHKHTKDQLWHTFIKRAFVMTKTDEDMDDFEPRERRRK